MYVNWTTNAGHEAAKIKKSEFMLFLARFGPLSLALKKVRFTFPPCWLASLHSHMADLLQQVKSIITEGRLWFHGNGDRTQCLKLLDHMPNNDKVNRSDVGVRVCIA